MFALIPPLSSSPLKCKLLKKTNLCVRGDKEKEKNEEKESAADEKDENAKEEDKNDFANVFGGGGGNGGRDGGEDERPPGAGNEPGIMLILGLIFATFLVSSMRQRGVT